MRQLRTHLDNKFYLIEDQLSGTTTDSYVVAADLDVRRLERIAIAIKNTGLNSLNVKISSKTYFGGTIENEDMPEVTLAAGNSLRYIETSIVSETIVSVKSTTPGSSTTYTIEYNGTEV